MAYTNSTWHAFWSSKHSKKTRFRLPKKKLKDNQYLEITDTPPLFISYGSFKEKGLGMTLDEIRNNYKNSKRPSAEDMHTIIEILESFKKDVDEYFEFKNFIRSEWLLPVKNKIKLLLKIVLKNKVY